MKIPKINPYHKDIDIPLYRVMERYYDILLDSPISNQCPRILLGRRYEYKNMPYYISLLEGDIADIGAGGCEWTRWFPNITTTFEPKPPQLAWEQPTSTEKFNVDFVKKYSVNKFDNAMAINSLHYVPLDELERTIKDAMSCVKNKFLFTFNFKMLAKRSKIKYVYDDILLQVIYVIAKCDFRIFLLDFENNDHTEGAINGDIRIILGHAR